MKSLAFKPSTGVLDNLDLKQLLVEKGKAKQKAWGGWTMREMQLVVKLRAHGASVSEIAEILSRSYASVAGTFNKHPRLRREADEMRKKLLQEVVAKHGEIEL